MKIFLFALSLALGACAHTQLQERGPKMDALAFAAHWEKLRLPTDSFVLTGYAPQPLGRNAVLTVYVEGDGLAWYTSSQASDDPTPLSPVALELALMHRGAGAVAYLARPCQHVQRSDWGACDTPWWTQQRFAPTVVQASSQAMDQLKHRFGADKLVLVGYSGGGAVAALVAARRDDVIGLVTLAGNLDTAAWTTHHGVRPLMGSLNPAEEWLRLQHVPQLHLVGARDRVIPVSLVLGYAQRYPMGSRPTVQVLPDVDHGCCWSREVGARIGAWTDAQIGRPQTPSQR